MASKQASRERFETLPQHDTAEQKRAVEVFKRRWKKAFWEAFVTQEQQQQTSPPGPPIPAGCFEARCPSWFNF